jgi:hypothetical protein
MACPMMAQLSRNVPRWLPFTRQAVTEELDMPNIANLKVAVLATDGFEQVELTEPVKALTGCGKTPMIHNILGFPALYVRC